MPPTREQMQDLDGRLNAHSQWTGENANKNVFLLFCLFINTGRIFILNIIITQHKGISPSIPQASSSDFYVKIHLMNLFGWILDIQTVMSMQNLYIGVKKTCLS